MFRNLEAKQQNQSAGQTWKTILRKPGKKTGKSAGPSGGANGERKKPGKSVGKTKGTDGKSQTKSGDGVASAEQQEANTPTQTKRGTKRPNMRKASGEKSGQQANRKRADAPRSMSPNVRTRQKRTAQVPNDLQRTRDHIEPVHQKARQYIQQQLKLVRKQ